MEKVELKNSIHDVLEIRKHAKQTIESGAVTVNYPLDLTQACRLLNQALASELMCVLRYRSHQIAAKGIDYPQVAAEFKEHADSEENHALLIAERIQQLGGKADFNPANITEKSSTEFGTSENLLSMIKEDLIAERIAIEVYRKDIQWFGDGDPTTRRMLEGILADEEAHADEMAGLLENTNRSTSGLRP